MGKKCRSCIYYAVSIGCCDYAEMTGKLRTVENGKIRSGMQKEQCDKYVKNERSKDVNWAVEKRSNWIKINGGY